MHIFEDVEAAKNHTCSSTSAATPVKKRSSSFLGTILDSLSPTKHVSKMKGSDAGEQPVDMKDECVATDEKTPAGQSQPGQHVSDTTDTEKPT
jgi:hypothetical protein